MYIFRNAIFVSLLKCQSKLLNNNYLFVDLFIINWYYVIENDIKNDTHFILYCL